MARVTRRSSQERSGAATVGAATQDTDVPDAARYPLPVKVTWQPWQITLFGLDGLVSIEPCGVTSLQPMVGQSLGKTEQPLSKTVDTHWDDPRKERFSGWDMYRIQYYLTHGSNNLKPYYCMGKVQDGTERWQESTFEDAVKSMIVHAKICNGTTITVDDINLVNCGPEEYAYKRQRGLVGT